jgi:adenylate kinase family enzyme
MPLSTDHSSQPRLERGVFLLLGASGSGKGSVGNALLKRGAISSHASMGAWLREALLNPATLESDLEPLQPADFASPLEYLRHCVTNGLLIPDAWTQTVIEHRIAVAPLERWALDGYPRTVGAAQHLVKALENAEIPLLGAVHLRVSDDVAVQRLLTRGRTDDEMKAIRQRLEFYRRSVLPTLEWLGAHSIAVTEVAAEPALEFVVDAVKRVLEDWHQKART